MNESELRRALVAEGLPAEVVERAIGYDWGNGPGDRYGAHRHDYDKALLCLAGTITFELPEQSRSVTLTVGERLDLPAGTLHGATVGMSGVRCHEIHLPAGTFQPRG